MQGPQGCTQVVMQGPQGCTQEVIQGLQGCTQDVIQGPQGCTQEFVQLQSKTRVLFFLASKTRERPSIPSQKQSSLWKGHSNAKKQRCHVSNVVQLKRPWDQEPGRLHGNTGSCRIDVSTLFQLHSRTPGSPDFT